MAERLWSLDLPVSGTGRASRLTDGFAGAVLEAVGTLGLRRPLVVSEVGQLSNLEAATGWHSAPLDRDARALDEALDRLPVSTSVESGTPLGGPRRLSVVVLDHCAKLSGGELAMARLLPACRDLDVRVFLGEDGPLVGRLERDEVPVEVIPMDIRAQAVSKDSVVPRAGLLRAVASTVRYSIALARRLRRDRTELVVTNSLKSDLYGGVAGRIAGVPVVWHLRDRISSDYLPSPAVTLIRLASRILPSGVIANSGATLESLQLGPHARRRLFARAIGSPCVSIRHSGTRRTVRNGALTVGMVGRLAPWKGQDVFLRAFARAFPEGTNLARIVGGPLFGESEFADALPGLAAELGIADRVELVGHSDEVEVELEGFDIAVHASVVAEPFGQVVVEAMASGCAVIATDGGGPAEVITDGVDGLLVPMGDIEALAYALSTLATDPALRVRLGTGAMSTAQRFVPERVAAEVEEAYGLVLARHLLRRKSTRRSIRS
jgi:glycosyltransferase involved in cell wall biosynthesis